MRIILGLALSAVLATGALAGDVPTEVATLKGQKVTLHIYPFLNADELTVLRLVKTNKDALKIFVTSAGGYSAMAVAPSEGLVRNGTFPPSVLAIGDLPDAQSAAAAALKGCNAKRNGGEACVVVLEVGPAR
jgi:hypothetical protein